MDITLKRIKGGAVTNLRLVEGRCPDGKLALESMREVSFDKLDGFFKRDIGRRRKECMHMIRHDNECVKLKTAFHALLLKNVHEEQCIGFDLKETPPIRACGRDEVRPEVLRGPFHVAMIAQARAEAVASFAPFTPRAQRRVLPPIFS